jgi:NTP pyrophosphatase (non-canonical NTP hydrolase)
MELAIYLGLLMIGTAIALGLEKISNSNSHKKLLQSEVSRWANSALPSGANHLKKLEQEIAELKDAPSDKMEMADVGLSLMLHAETQGVDLLLVMREKFEIVKERKYGPLDADGISQHIEGSNAEIRG